MVFFCVVNNNTDGFDEQERRFLIQNLHFLYPTYGNPVTGCLSSHGQQLPLISMNNSEPGESGSSVTTFTSRINVKC